MTLSTSLYYDRSVARLNAINTQTQTLQTQISSGKKLQAPSDDTVAYQRLQGIAVAGANDVQTSRNITLAQTLLQETDSTLGTISSQIQRAQELAIQANSGTLSTADRQIIAGQLRGVIDDLVLLANTRDARGGPLFGAANGDTGVTVSGTGAVSFTGTGTPASIPIGDAGSIQPTESAERVFGGIPTPSGTSDVFAIIGTLAAALESGGNVNAVAGDVITGLGAASDQLNAVRGSAGARSARLDLETTRLADTNVTRETDRSSLEDTDLTSAISNLQRATTVLQATQASFARLSSLSLFDYLR